MIFRSFSFCRLLSSTSLNTAQESLFPLIKAKIKMTGPITVAEYMKEVLTNRKGYYMTKDVFGQKGDFITSPEVSQLFGEMLGVWSVNEVLKLGKMDRIQLIELGPGRGTMTKDLLRVWSKLGTPGGVPLSIHLVEVSPVLSNIQASTLCSSSSENNDSSFYRSGNLKGLTDTKVFWYRSIKDVPRIGFSVLFCNEFFDALPIHRFKKIDGQWREVLIDVDPDNESSLRYVISRGPTPASLLFLKDYNGDECEVCPQAWDIMDYLSKWFEEEGGFAIACDYGSASTPIDTFRGFCRHQLADPLSEPGTADLTADVDFSALKRAVSDKMVALGPVSQAKFLSAMHASARLEILIKNCKTDIEKANLQSAYDYLTSPTQMGERFKLMAFYPAVLHDYLKKFPPPGFE